MRIFGIPLITRERLGEMVARAQREEKAAADAKQAALARKHHEKAKADNLLPAVSPMKEISSPSTPKADHVHLLYDALCRDDLNLQEIDRLLEEITTLEEFRDDKNRTFLHMAIMQRNPDIVRLLYEKGVDVKAQDDLGYTVLHYAAMMKIKGRDNDILQLLLDIEAVGINIKSNEGCTALSLVQALLLTYPDNNVFWERKALLESRGAEVGVQVTVDFRLPHFQKLGDREYWYDLKQLVEKPGSTTDTDSIQPLSGESDSSYCPPAQGALGDESLGGTSQIVNKANVDLLIWRLGNLGWRRQADKIGEEEFEDNYVAISSQPDEDGTSTTESEYVQIDIVGPSVPRSAFFQEYSRDARENRAGTEECASSSVPTASVDGDEQARLVP